MAAPSHIRLVVHPARRAAGHTDWPVAETEPELAELPVPSLDALAHAADTHRPAGITWLSGGEPTLRADLPELIARLHGSGHTVGLDTDGLALHQPRVLQALHDRGLRWLRLPLHSMLPAAHDWIEGTPGSARRVKRTAAAARAVGLQLAGTVLVTRSTVPHLVDTVRTLAALGARRVHLRRPRTRGVAGTVDVTVSPRLGLSEPYLEAAVARGRDASVPVRLDGFPRCAAPRVRSAAFTHDVEAWVLPAELDAALGPLLAEPAPAPPCPRCPGPPTCAGPSAAYVARFGRVELDDPGLSPTARPSPRPLEFGTTPAVPPPRDGRSPATRLRFAVRQAAVGDLGGDPTAGMDHNPTAPLVHDLSGPTRDVKLELVRLAQAGPAPVLIDAGPRLTRPEAHALLRELLRLGFTEVTVAGDVTALGRRTRRALARLKGVHRFVGELWHPEPALHDALAGADHHAATLSALHALAGATGAELGVTGLLPARPAADGLAPWHTAWTPDGLPGDPAFRFTAAPDGPAWERHLSAAPPPVADALRKALERAVRAE